MMPNHILVQLILRIREGRKNIIISYIDTFPNKTMKQSFTTVEVQGQLINTSSYFLLQLDSEIHLQRICLYA